MFGVGLAMTVGAVAAIFISSASEGQNNQNTGGQTQDISQQDQSQPNQQQQQTRQDASSKNNSTSPSTTIMTITIPQGAATQQVQKYYQPDPAKIADGSESQITWDNKDIAAHTATATDNKSFDTGIIQPGSSGSAIVRGQGEIPYYCTIHPFMKASLQIVSD